MTAIVDIEEQGLSNVEGTTDILTIGHSPTHHAFLAQFCRARQACSRGDASRWLLDTRYITGRSKHTQRTLACTQWCGQLMSVSWGQAEGVIDIQLMWCKVIIMTEDWHLRAKVAMVKFVTMTAEDTAAFKYTEYRGHFLWNPDRGGDFTVFKKETLCISIIFCPGRCCADRKTSGRSCRII